VTEIVCRRVLVAGCGAIGSVFGGLLRYSGHEVTLLGRPWHLDAIASHGLRIDGIWGEHHVSGFHLAEQPSELHSPFDLVLLCVKAYDTESMVASIADRVAPAGDVLSLQNGLGNLEALARAFGPARSLGASVLVGARIPRPGCVTVTVQAAPVVFGPLDARATGAMGRARGLADTFRRARIDCRATDSIVSYLWAKVLYNAPLNAVGALLNLHYGALGEDSALRAIMDRVIDEAFAVALAENVPLDWSSAAAYRDYFYGSLLPATFVHRSSMLQDLERGRQTEIDAINGEVWRRGNRLGIATPFNELLTLLISARTRAGARAAQP